MRISGLHILLFTALLACLVSCSRPESHVIDDAERVAVTNPDSALTMLSAIDPTTLGADSVRAKYHYLKGWLDMQRFRSMVGDSLISAAHSYYSGKDVVRAMRSATAMAWRKYWMGDTQGAMAMLDLLANQQGVPDSLIAETLRVRVVLDGNNTQGKNSIELAKRLVSIETTPERTLEAKYSLAGFYIFAQQPDSAIAILDELIAYAKSHHMGEQQFQFEVDRAGALTEAGRYRESDEAVDAIFRKSSADNGAADILHVQKAVNAVNSGDIGRASRELALADSLAVKLRGDDDVYYNRVLRLIIEYAQTGRFRQSHANDFYNRQQGSLSRINSSLQESERSALEQHSRAMALQAKNEHKSLVIVVIAFALFIAVTALAWIVKSRRSRERENEERAEALQKMIDDLRATQPSQAGSAGALRRAMLQQLGIIKMVAETPTEQNREMLQKISAVGGETNGELVNWDNVHEVIDNLYSGFYTKLHGKYGATLSDKEEHIVTLMVAGFSTKEISVITGQTTATIYVRKSSVRKKLGLPEKGDIVNFLRQELSC